MLADWNVPPLMDVPTASVNICGLFVVRASVVRPTLDMNMLRYARMNGNQVRWRRETEVVWTFIS